jgi:hypothetical protein
VNGGDGVTDNEECVEMFYLDPMFLDLLSKGGAERCEESLGPRIYGKHRGGDSACERSYIQDQTTFPTKKKGSKMRQENKYVTNCLIICGRME